MTEDPKDPFKDHPALRPKIADPATSQYRDIDVAAMDEHMRANGAGEDWRRTDAAREETRQRALAGRQGADLWVFGYGSLMWDPGFHFSHVTRAKLTGYHRRFCLRTVIGRGTPKEPGLMAGLDHGGQCDGLAFCIDGPLVEAETGHLWKREMSLPGYVPTFVTVETSKGPLEAMTFVVDHTADIFMPEMSDEQTATYLATAAGLFGTNLSYLDALIGQLAILGIEDQALIRLQRLSHARVEARSREE
ncbi:MAG: gamma-glutamylcyclotransferase [Pseudomonadota bacterium]